jgi:predicted protein tyrosine phosphatase
MKIFIMSKRQFNEMIFHNHITLDNIENFTTSFFISIDGTIGEKYPACFNENKENLLCLKFDDVGFEADIGHGLIAKPMSHEQGKQLYDFIMKHKDRKLCYVHCGAGISRSGAVGSFVQEISDTNYEEFKRMNRHIAPNPYVLSILHKIHRENG